MTETDSRPPRRDHEAPLPPHRPRPHRRVRRADLGLRLRRRDPRRRLRRPDHPADLRRDARRLPARARPRLPRRRRSTSCLGAVGLPVFAEHSSGLGVFTGVERRLPLVLPRRRAGRRLPGQVRRRAQGQDPRARRVPLLAHRERAGHPPDGHRRADARTSTSPWPRPSRSTSSSGSATSSRRPWSR